MHAFSASGQELVILDAFGLTRFVLPTKPKTPAKSKRNDKVAGGKLRANGDTLLAYNVRSNRISTWRISDLKQLKHGFSDYDASAPLEDGAHVLTADWGGGLRLQTFEGAAVGNIAFSEVKALGKLELGPRLPSLKTNVASEIWTGPEGAFALFDARRGVIRGGVIAAGTTEANACWELDIGQPAGLLEVLPGVSSTLVRVYVPSESQTHCVRVTTGGVVTQVVKSDGPATFDGSRIVYEHAGVIFRTTFEGATEELAKVVDDAPGEVMARGDAVFRMSSDRERLLEVKSGIESIRKLPESEREARVYLLSVVRLANEQARPSNALIELTDLAPPAYGNWLTPRLSWSYGDRSLLGSIAIGATITNFMADTSHRPRGTWALGSYNNQVDWCPPTRAQALEAIAHMERTGLSLVDGLHYLATPLEQSFGRASDAHPATDISASEAMAKVVLAALVHIAKTGAQAGMAEAAKTDVDRAELIRHLNADFFDAANKVYTQPAQAALFLALAAFGRDAKSVLRDWTEVNPSGFAKSNAHITGVVLKLYAARYPE